jgi:predicted transposase YbfD/YdcC
MAIPLLDGINIEGKTVTADALLTQRGLADHLVRERKAHYHFTVKANQAALLQDIACFFLNRKEPCGGLSGAQPIKSFRSEIRRSRGNVEA